ncbi:MAG: hypothetical protein R3C03_02070 [Pirellulaceae bacterium]
MATKQTPARLWYPVGMRIQNVRRLAYAFRRMTLAIAGLSMLLIVDSFQTASEAQETTEFRVETNGLPEHCIGRVLMESTPGLIEAFAFTNDGRWLVVQSNQGVAQLLDLQTQSSMPIGVEGERWSQFLFTPDGSILFSQSCTEDSTAIWDVQHGEQLSKVSVSVLGMRMDEDGQAVIGLFDQSIQQISSKSPFEMSSLAVALNDLKPLAISADRRWVVGFRQVSGTHVQLFAHDVENDEVKYFGISKKSIARN